MSTAQIVPPSSPGRRRKGPKTLPRLPLSAFNPPDSGTSERFHLPSSPSTIHPDDVIDAHIVATNGDLSQWKEEAGEALGGRIGGVVLSLEGKQPAEFENAIAELESHIDVPVISLLIPFSLETAPPVDPPSYLPGSAKLPISLSTTFVKSTPECVPALTWALGNSRVVDIDIRSDLTESDTLWEGFEELLTTVSNIKQTPIVLSNILPPPHNLTLPIVQLMGHPTYRAYQAHTAALSLFPKLYVKFLPPTWNAPTPPTPPPNASFENTESKEKKEWKRRIKMYLAPVLEAFGYERIIFGSSHSSASNSSSSAGDWYEIARESFAELGVEQEAIDAVFSGNAKKVYGSS